MLVRRKPRKLIRLAVAAEILQVSRSTVRNLIAEQKLQAVRLRPGTTSPIKVYQAQVDQLAQQWGIF